MEKERHTNASTRMETGGEKMLFNTHVKIGSLLHTWFVESFACRLPRQAFLYGNIKPDLERHGSEDRHLLENAQEWISQRVTLLREEVEKPVEVRDAIRAGILAGEICHHVSDAFCLYHDDPSLYPDFKHHFLYELGLHRRFMRMQQEGALRALLPSVQDPKETRRPWPSAAGVMAELYAGLQDYHGQPPSRDLDIKFALRGCAETLTRLSPMLRLILSEESVIRVDTTKLPAFALLFQPEGGSPVFPETSVLMYDATTISSLPSTFTDASIQASMDGHEDTLPEWIGWRKAI